VTPTAHDSRLVLSIGRLLRAGLITSTACLACGLVLMPVHPAAGSWLLAAGIAVLIASPPARVALSIVEYVLQRDWMFAGLTALVLIELAASVVAALVFNRRL
jgi:uncharacterized membrane protein